MTENTPEWALTKTERSTQDFAETLSKIFESRKKEFKAALGKWQENGFQSMNPDFFKRLIMTAANGNANLLNCTRSSLYQAALEIAQLQLEPNTNLQEAFLIPYKTKGQTICQVQIGRNGWVKLAYRTGLVSGVNALPVFRGEEFIWQPHMEQEILHVPDVEIDEDAELVAVYAWVDLKDGRRIYEVLRKKDIERIKSNIRYHSDAWKKYPDRMACRSALKRLIRTRLPVNEFLADKQSLDRETGGDDLIIDTYATDPESQEPDNRAQEAAGRVRGRVKGLSKQCADELDSVTIDVDTGEILEPQGATSQPDGADQSQPHDKEKDNTKDKLSVSRFWKAVGEKNDFWGTRVAKKEVTKEIKRVYGEMAIGQLNDCERHSLLASVEEMMRKQKKDKENDDVAF